MELKAEQKPDYDWRETGRVIGFYRRSLHLSIDEITKRMGCVKSTLSFWERGIKEPKISNLVAVAEALGVSEMVRRGKKMGKYVFTRALKSNNTLVSS